jgi:hypothetical protein
MARTSTAAVANDASGTADSRNTCNAWLVLAALDFDRGRRSFFLHVNATSLMVRSFVVPGFSPGTFLLGKVSLE